MKYYGSEKYPIAHFPFNFMLAAANDYFTSKKLHENIIEWLKNMPEHGVANWVVSTYTQYTHTHTHFLLLQCLNEGKP